MTRFRSLEIFQRIIHLSPIIYIYIYIFSFAKTASLPRHFRSKIDIVSFEKISRPAWNSLMKILATLVSWVERKIDIYIYKKLYKCQRLVLFVGSKPTREWINSLSFSLSLPLTPFVRRQSCDLFKEEIHSRPYDIRFNEFIPL